ncbi:MAG: hypothetical protein IID52_00010 [Proteobacteria bacterium]|nr:hypothetical protein [Pseudomonadota bacterium]
MNRAGDGAIYIFTDADQAVSASKNFMIRLDQFNKETNTLQSSFKVRIGLNTGEVLANATQKHPDVLSQVLDIAGHLQKQAEAGEVLITESTFRQLIVNQGFRPREELKENNESVYSLEK